MSPLDPLEILQLVGYSVGAVLPLWMAIQLVSHRSKLTSLERMLALLALTMGGWHTSNLVITLHSLFDLGYDPWTTVLRIADTVSVVSITFAYSFLLHVHLHLWANAHSRPLTRSEQLRVYLSYLPTVFLALAIPLLWKGEYAPMFVKLRFFVIPFAFWIAYVLGLIAVTEILIARLTANRSERRIMRTLAASFVGVGVVIFAALAFGVGEGTVAGLYLKTIANLGSLLPSVLLAYYIYRYRYLEIIIEESLVVVTFATVVLTVYVFGIRTIGDWVTQRYGMKPGLVEALLILALALVAAPFRGWLAQRFQKLFERETALYKQIVSRIGSYAGQYKDLVELFQFVEERTSDVLGLRRVKILVTDEQPDEWVTGVLQVSRVNGWLPVEDNALLTEQGFKLAYPLRREEKVAGLLAVDAAGPSLTPDARSVIGTLADQVAIAIDDSRLMEENVRLERELAERERLASLGRMAATVAHEIKNPLSAIKSIAQVMREDENLNNDYARDLNLIVGETDRLSQSVTQLLSFARRESPADQALGTEELVSSVIGLFHAQAREQGISLSSEVRNDPHLNGKCVSAVRDALSNLLLNALQATTRGGKVSLSASVDNAELVIGVQDTGPGVPIELREQIWEPFFTTRQRGTGLGLAIVRKRVQEVGGSASLATFQNGHGALFLLRVPIETVN
ncbi:MAG TPA: ATP-binding protein [Pyrinomonadaceae bacterium]|jgi:Osmosensitive K+ channel histidine kinase|nr:ATP-binding protein [Pyrinomonadaceae bacterium]